MVVDFHSHDFPDAIAPRAMAGMCRMTAGTLWPSGDGTEANHLAALECAGVDRAVVCPIATKPAQWEPILRRATDIMSGAHGERARTRFVPFASVHPNDPDVIAHLEAIAAAGVKGVKFHPYYQDFSLADPAVWPMFGKIADLGLVVVCHAGGDVSWKTERGKCGPDEIAALLAAVPGLAPRFVAAHLGGCFRYGPHATDRLLATGCYVDTSALHARWHYDEEMRILRAWPRERILFATDFPWVALPEAIRWVRSVRDPADWPAVFGDNAARLLNLS